MAIDGGMREKLEAGTQLVATYKKTEHTAEVVAGDDGKLRFRLADGRVFKSPSAAGSAVMGGTACNGWRFWSIEPTPEQRAVEVAGRAPKTRPAAKKAKRAKPEEEAGSPAA